jgi:hypothetical protein
MIFHSLVFRPVTTFCIVPDYRHQIVGEFSAPKHGSSRSIINVNLKRQPVLVHVDV